MARKPTDTVQLKLRFDEKLRRQLEREAAKNDRSLNAEIISRLQRPFNQADVLAEILGGPKTTQLLLTLANAIKIVEIEKGKAWHQDLPTWRHAQQAILNVINLVREPPNSEKESILKTLMDSDIPANAAARAVNAAKTATEQKPKANKSPATEDKP
jgi:hypothetical protein